jgi:hypothetical protein
MYTALVLALGYRLAVGLPLPYYIVVSLSWRLTYILRESVYSISIESSRLISRFQKRPIMASFPYFAEAEAKYSGAAELVPI